MNNRFTAQMTGKLMLTVKNFPNSGWTQTTWFDDIWEIILKFIGISPNQNYSSNQPMPKSGSNFADPAMFNFGLLNAGFKSFGASDGIITVWDFKSEG